MLRSCAGALCEELTTDVEAYPDGSGLSAVQTLQGASSGFPLVPEFSKTELQQLSPAALAYLGDAVYELYVRLHYLMPPKRIQTYHHQVVAQVRAESQASHLQVLLPHLTPEELEIVKRGRNAATVRTRRVNPDIYQQATSLETLIGHLYLTHPERLIQLLNQMALQFPSNN